MASYIDRINKIRDALEATADSIENRDYITDAMEERAEAYRAAIESLDDAIAALEGLE